MRTFLIITALIIVFISGSVFTEFYINSEITNMEKSVESISTTDDLKSVMKKWEKLSKSLEIIIDHGDLEEVSKLLYQMEEEIIYDFDEFMESKSLALQMLKHIKERNTLGVINVLQKNLEYPFIMWYHIGR